MRFSLSPVAPVSGQAVLPLAAAKAHLRVLHDYEDELIGALRDAAVNAVEQHTGKSLIARSYSWRGRFGSSVQLGTGPVNSVTTVQYLDANGVEQSPVPAAVAKIGLDGELLPATGTCWPETADADGAVEITFMAGYAAGACPPSLIMAAKLMIGTLYANRESVVVGVSVNSLPMGFSHLCQPYRSMRV